MNKYRITKYKRWDISEAKYHYWWTLEEYRKPRFRKADWYPVKDFHYDSMGGSRSPVRYYSVEQVRAAAKHYGIEAEL